MCAYNRVNGIHASQHRWLLTEVLRDEWGFDGLVVSDWGAVHDRVAALAAGLDLEMPPNLGISDARDRRARSSPARSTSRCSTPRWRACSTSSTASQHATANRRRRRSTRTPTTGWPAPWRDSARCC